VDVVRTELVVDAVELVLVVLLVLAALDVVVEDRAAGFTTTVPAIHA